MVKVLEVFMAEAGVVPQQWGAQFSMREFYILMKMSIFSVTKQLEVMEVMVACKPAGQQVFAQQMMMASVALADAFYSNDAYFNASTQQVIGPSLITTPINCGGHGGYAHSTLGNNGAMGSLGGGTGGI